jgi:FlaA1/EpsC-like NDP-sugar epimerase
VLVYGSGLRYRAFRRELVRSLAVNNRTVVGLIDDNLLLHGKYIGGVKVLGGIRQAAKLIAKCKVDAVVVACEISKEKEKIVLDLLAPTGVKVSRFGFSEKPLMV